MKLKKKSGLIGAVVALSAASLVSVGFASWVISQGDTADVAGNITVDTVSDSRYLISDADGDIDVNYGLNKSNIAATSICFGWDSTGAVGTPWLLNSDTAKAENLTADIVFWVSNLKTTDSAVLSADLSLTGSSEDQAAFTTASTAGANQYVLPLSSVTKTFAIAADGEGNTKTISGLTYRKVTLSLEFGWGSYFGSPAKNPYAFFNDGSKSAATDGDDAKAALQAIEAFDGVGFNVHLVTTAPAA